ncbi:hybrid sensor histidine kinase/response regulator [Ramlibacter humi]|uniref:histidine kinase n=1 Tax=Ramlibacter humi TaxID=2530451 RepID=A0A4Z0C9H4_9BURK|nr:ATP-binding protein [Ramlibacter humi]TFZ08316.1 PAS domain S-box protein [Ramlibacter humi]
MPAVRRLQDRRPRFGPAVDALRELLELTADWVWEADANLRMTLVRCSPGYADQGQLPPVRRACWDGLDSEQERARCTLRAAMEARQPLQGIEVVRLDSQGRPRHLRVSGRPIFGRNGRFEGYRGVGQEITSHKQAEQALNASESQLAAVIDTSVDAIITVDAEGRIVLFNRGAGAMFGCSRMEALGRTLHDWLPQAAGFIATAHARAAITPAELVRGLALQARRTDGTGFPAEASLSRIVLGGNALYCLTVRDLTQPLQAEQARQSLELQLRQSQKMEALGTLAGGIAHDFNNIVAAIMGNARLARDHCDAGSPARPFISEIASAGVRARDLVQRILSFSRNQPAVFTCQALQPLVREGVQLLRAMLPSGIQVVCDVPDEDLLVCADPTQVSQVLMNLGTNAWQAIGRQGRITVSLAREGREACLCVADNGCGMDAGTVERIFEPFFTTKAKGEGTGLGLPVVHGIVSSHGGRITVDSQPGEGTVFRIWLPMAQESAARAQPAPPPLPAAVDATERRGRGEHVLYLDDYPAMVLMVTAVLEGRGYRVTGFDDPLRALEWLREHAGETDLVVSDYNMPGCSGLELAQQLRHLRPELPLVLASGYITDELRQGAAELGVRSLFDKPRGVEELCDLVGEVLQG